MALIAELLRCCASFERHCLLRLPRPLPQARHLVRAPRSVQGILKQSLVTGPDLGRLQTIDKA